MKWAIKIMAVSMTGLLLAGGKGLTGAAKKMGQPLLYVVTGEGEAVVTGSSVSLESVVIPASIDGFPVAGVAEAAFQDQSDIKSVILNEGVRYIGANAFAGCEGLEEIELAGGLQYIGEGAFLGDINVEEVFLPEGVLYVGEHAFGDCERLVSVEFPMTACVDDYAFEGSAWQEARDEGVFQIRGSSLIKAGGIGESVLEVPYGVTEIGPGGWMGPAILDQSEKYEEIILPNTLVEMEEFCFIGNWINRMRIPENVKEIQASAFEWFTTDEIQLPQGIRVIRNGAFCESALSRIELPDTLEVIERAAFIKCQMLEEITIPGSVRYIGSAAFSHCNSLREVTFEEGLTVVAADAFSYCDSLERIQYPESLQSIEGETFSSALRRVYIPQGTVNIDERLFYYFKEYDSPVVVYGQRGSRAEEAARAYGMEFVAVENGNEMP